MLCMPYLAAILHSSSLDIFAALLITPSESQLSVHLSAGQRVYAEECIGTALVMCSCCPRNRKAARSCCSLDKQRRFKAVERRY